MTTAAEVLVARQLRDAARGIVKTDVATVRQELVKRSLLARIRDSVVQSVTKVADDGLAVANENRAIVAITLAAVAGWMFRRPLGTLAQRMNLSVRRTIKRWRR